MATASVEIGGLDLKNYSGSSLNGACLTQESLTISATAATSGAVSAGTLDTLGNLAIARVTVDTDCWMAKGTTPDPTSIAKTNNSSARRFMPAGSSIEFMIAAGEKVAVKGV